MTAPDSPDTPVVLASASASRRSMLVNAGVAVGTDPASIDEDEVKRAFKADGAGADDCAEALAEMKAKRVAARHPDALVIGADQMLVCGDVWFDKPPDGDHARAQLLALRGKTHELIASCVVFSRGARVWHHTDRARLTVRPFSDGFLDGYLARVGDAALHSVGGYQLEGLGAQLFSRVEGDYFTVLGLPLLPLLDYLRTRGVLAA